MAPTAITPPQGPSKHPPPTKTPPSTNPATLETLPTTPQPTDPIPPLRQTLLSPTTPLATRFRALFTLKHHASLPPPHNPTTLPAIHAISLALTSASASALLKHELAYCLGQTGNLAAVEPLRRLLKDRKEDAMCRHEAAEALGALGDVGSVGLLRECMAGVGEEVVVKETCELALRRIEWVNETGPGGRVAEEEGRERGWGSDFLSVDPAPSAVSMVGWGKDGKGLTVKELGERLMRRELGLFERYRAMFALRDLASPPDRPTAVEAVEMLARGLWDESALFRHEIAFVFGQLCHPASVPCLKECLAGREEMSMVRHEAAEALGSLGEEEGVEEFLRGFLDDPEEVVRESIIVALDMAEEGREFGNEAQEDFASRHRNDGL